MRKVILLLIVLAAGTFSALPSLTLPNEDINGVDTPQVVWVDQNFDSVKAIVNRTVDTVNALQAGTAAFSGLTASLPIFTNSSKRPVSNPMTGTGSVMMSVSPTTTGTLTGAAANFSGNVTADSIVSAKMYAPTSFTVTLTGVSGTVTGTAYAQLLGGRVVVLELPSLTGTSNTTAATITGIPSGWRPARAVGGQPAVVYDNSSPQTGGALNIGTSGTITLYFNGLSSFTGSGTKGIDGLTVTYIK
jgi:hypothetical protein